MVCNYECIGLYYLVVYQKLVSFFESPSVDKAVVVADKLPGVVRFGKTGEFWVAKGDYAVDVQVESGFC